MGAIEDIKKFFAEGKLVIGKDEILKKLKNGEIARVYATSNCPEEERADIEHFCRLAKAELVRLDIPNDDLGVVCKKPFSISVLGLVKE